MKTDSQIQSEIIQELKWEPQVNHEQIGVAVSDGIATLLGTVPSFIEKSAAERTAQQVSGVRAVVEKIEVKIPGSYRRDDEDIAHTILEQFKWNIQVPDDLVKARVEGGWVELSGEVEWEYQRAATEKCVRGLTGVKGITNSIFIKAKEVQPELIKQRIEEALRVKAEREARRIKVEVSGHRVVLTGDVHSFSEANDVRGAAFGTPGVTSVVNNLTVRF